MKASDRTLASNIILGVSSIAEQPRFKYIFLKMRIDHGNSNLLPQLFIFIYVPFKNSILTSLFVNEFTNLFAFVECLMLELQH